MEFNINYKQKINTQKKNIIVKNVKTSSALSFNGNLTRIAEKSPCVPAEVLQAANKIYTREKGITGKFPNEFIFAIKHNLTSSEHLEPCVKGIMQTFAQTSAILQKLETETINNFERYARKLSLQDYLDYLREIIQVSTTKDPKEAIRLNKAMEDKFLPDEEFIKSIEEKTRSLLNDGAKQNKLVSPNAEVDIKRLGNGYFGTAYKLTFLEDGNNEIIIPKVIKSYNDLTAKNNVKFDFFLNAFKILKNNYESVVKYINSLFENLAKRDIPNLEIIKERFLHRMSRNNGMDETAYKNRIVNEFLGLMNEHGLHKETVFANYARKASGNNLQSSDLIEYHYTDFNSRYALLNFSDEEAIGPVIKHVDYDALGFSPHDIEQISKFTNFVGGRLIDYGDFSITNPTLATNPVARKTYKKLKHCYKMNKDSNLEVFIRQYNELFKKATKNEISWSNDVLLGLEEIRKLIEKEGGEMLIKNNLS